MAKNIFLGFILLFSLAFAVTLSASQIHHLDVSKLSSLASHIVIGEVTAVASDKDGVNEVVVNVRSVLKGTTKEKTFHIPLHTAGVRDFDPRLQVGDIAVFFLKSLENGRGEKAYHGSIALFTKPVFQ